MNCYRIFLVMLLTALPLIVKAQANVDEGLVDLVEKIDARNAELHTMKAQFVQRREINLLRDPVEKKGVMYLKKSAGIKFDFEPKEDLTIIITPEAMVALSPAAKKADLIPIKKRNLDLTQTVLSDKLADLPDYFRITRAVSQDANDPYQRLVLVPTRRKFRKKFEELEVRINEDYLITHLKVVSADGDVFELFFDNIEVNLELDDELFDTTIPDDYEMGKRMDAIFGPGVDFQ